MLKKREKVTGGKKKRHLLPSPGLPALNQGNFSFMVPKAPEILARYHAPGAGWYWKPHTVAINIPIYFLTYIFYYLKNISKYSFKNSGQQRDSNHRPMIMSQAA